MDLLSLVYALFQSKILKLYSNLWYIHTNTEGDFMELTKKQVSITKGVAILFMLLLHLFCTKDYQGLFTPLIIIKGVPLVYYLALFGDCCVAIYCFCSGYGLMCTYKNNPDEYNKKNSKVIY